jgi:hypothetical protein
VVPRSSAEGGGPRSRAPGIGPSPSVLAGLCTAGEAAARIERFHELVEAVDGIPLQVLENTATAGDVILMHPLLLHATPTTNLGCTPRFLLNKDICL